MTEQRECALLRGETAAVARFLRLGGVLAVLQWWSVIVVQPAASADNCSSLADCASTANAGISLGAVAVGIGLLSVFVLPSLVLTDDAIGAGTDLDGSDPHLPNLTIDG